MKNVYLFTRIVSFSMLLFVIAACTLTITPAPAPVSDEACYTCAKRSCFRQFNSEYRLAVGGCEE